MQRLRKRAERYLKRDATCLADPTHDVQRLNHELQVHQIELEWQSEALRRAKDEIKAALNERISFYRALSHDLAQPIFALGLLLKSPEDRSSQAEQEKILTQIASSPEVSKALSRSLNDHLAIARAKGLHIGCVASSVNGIRARCCSIDTSPIWSQTL